MTDDDQDFDGGVLSREELMFVQSGSAARRICNFVGCNLVFGKRKVGWFCGLRNLLKKNLIQLNDLLLFIR